VFIIEFIFEEIRELKERLEELEFAMEEVDEQQGDRPLVHSFDGIKVDLGGFLHSTYTYVDAENGSAGSFNRQNFELLIGAELTESWSAFIAAGFLREANDPFTTGSPTDPVFDTNNRNPLIIAWANYEYNEALNVRMGRLSTPHGIINIEHFPATLLDPEQPQFLRPFGGNTIFPNFSTGIQLHGKFFGNSGTLSYSTYATNATGANTESNSEEILGGRVAFASASGALELGLNYSDSFRGSTNSDNELTGVDLKLELGRFQLKAEAFATDEEIGNDRSAFSITDKWTAFYRYDELETTLQSGTSIENMIGLNYLPSQNIRLRLTYTHKEFEDRLSDDLIPVALADTDADILQISGTFSF